MSLLFADPFDFYGTVTDYWDATGPVGGGGGDVSIRLNTGQARTGIGCLQINSGGFGPGKNIPHTQNLLLATNWNSNTAGSCLRFLNTDITNGANATVIDLSVNLDGSLSVINSPNVAGGVVLGSTSASLVTFNTYNSIALRVFCHPTLGTVTVWVNGFVVLNLVGVRTTHHDFPGLLYYNEIEPMGPGGIPTVFHDDLYCLDCGTSPNNTFLGALRLYAQAPVANAAVSWTPNGAAQNFACVNEIPPDGDTTYVSTSGVDNVDQYVYNATGVPLNSSIPFAVHCLDERVDSGSNQVASVINGSVNANPVALTSNYHIYPANYDTNPGTGHPFTLGDFPLNAGPKLAA